MISGGHNIPAPVAVAVFENHVFYADITKLAVMQANKSAKSWPINLTHFYKVDHGVPTAIAVSHPSLQVLTSRGEQDA